MNAPTSSSGTWWCSPASFANRTGATEQIDERGAVQAGTVRFGLLQAITARLSQTLFALKNNCQSNRMPYFRLNFMFFGMFCIAVSAASQPWLSPLSFVASAIFAPVALGLYAHVIEKHSRQDSSLLTYLSAIAMQILLFMCSNAHRQYDAQQNQLLIEELPGVILPAVFVGFIAGAFSGLFSVLIFSILAWLVNLRNDG